MDLIDRLADIRRSKRLLRDEEQRIIQQIIDGSAPLRGKKYIARVVKRVVLRELGEGDTYHMDFLRELEERSGLTNKAAPAQRWDVV